MRAKIPACLILFLTMGSLSAGELVDQCAAEITAEEKKVFNKITDLLDTAVSPYVTDIVKELEKLEEEE